MRGRLAVVIAALTASCLLAGCAAPTTPPLTSTPTVTPATSTLTPTPIPTPTPPPEPPAPTGPPPLASLVLTPDGLGPLRMGQPFPTDDPSTAVATWHPDACEWETEPDWRGRWVANYPKLPDGRNAFQVAQNQDGVLASVGVYRDVGIRTDRGIGLGSTRDEFLAAYPEAMLGDRGTAYFVPAGAGWLSFTILDDEFGTEEHPANVVSIMELRNRQFEVYATDGGVGYCI